MFCQQCGAKIGDNDAFCMSCGAKVSNASPVNANANLTNANANSTSNFKSNPNNLLKNGTFNVDAILSSDSSNFNIFIAAMCAGTIITDFLSYLLIGSVGYVFSEHWLYYLALVVIAVLAAVKIDLKIFIAGLGVLAIEKLIYFIKALSYNPLTIFLRLVSFGAVMLTIVLVAINAFNVLGEEKKIVNKCYFIPAAVALFVLFLNLTFGRWIMWAFNDLVNFNFFGLFSWGFSIVSELLFVATLFLIGKYSINNK